MELTDLAGAKVTRNTDASIRVNLFDLEDLLKERDALREQVTSLQTDATARLERTLARRVRAFHAKFGHPVAHTPHVPDDATVRFRLSLIAEEFVELCAAALDNTEAQSADSRALSIRIAEDLHTLIQTVPIKVLLPEFYDALLDLAYVIEGTHAAFGTDAAIGMDEVHRANMDKDPVYVAVKDAYHGQPGAVVTERTAFIAKRGESPTEQVVQLPDPKAKPTKPADWTPPDIVRVLREQGWHSSRPEHVSMSEAISRDSDREVAGFEEGR